MCAPASQSCKTAGNPCGTGPECCSKLCQNGKCSLGASYCIQPRDVCYRSVDCCSGYCAIAAGVTAGTCQDLPVGGAGSCTQDGTVCSGCGECCSRQCAVFPASGVKICQPPSGCRVTNNLCRRNTDCCGGDPLAMTEDPANTACKLASGMTVGTCSNPNGCQPRGNICGRREFNGTTNNCGGNEREACCDCPSPKFNCCKPDLAGIFRCHGGGSQQCPNGYAHDDPNCCVRPGERCQFASECCGGVPCVPDAQGVLRCLVPRDGGGPTCVEEDGVCTTTSDCCGAARCRIQPGNATGVCRST
jgi:hypothetical protein